MALVETRGMKAVQSIDFEPPETQWRNSVDDILGKSIQHAIPVAFVFDFVDTRDADQEALIAILDEIVCRPRQAIRIQKPPYQSMSIEQETHSFGVNGR